MWLSKINQPAKLQVNVRRLVQAGKVTSSLQIGCHCTRMPTRAKPNQSRKAKGTATSALSNSKQHTTHFSAATPAPAAGTERVPAPSRTPSQQLPPGAAARAPLWVQGAHIHSGEREGHPKKQRDLGQEKLGPSVQQPASQCPREGPSDRKPGPNGDRAAPSKSRGSPASPNHRARPPARAAQRALLQNGDFGGSAGSWGGACRMRQIEVRGWGCAGLPQRIFSSSYEGHQQKNLTGELF